MRTATEHQPLRAEILAAVSAISAMDPPNPRDFTDGLLGTIVVSGDAFEQAAQGAAALDRAVPGWHRSVNLDRLSMGDGGRCVLGYTHGDYGVGRDDIFGQDAGQRVASLLGFDRVDEDDADHWGLPDPGRHWPTFDDLTEAWGFEIVTRLAADTDQAQAAEQSDARATMGGDASARYL